jgi:hypothetical protein
MKWKFFFTVREKNYMVPSRDETFQLSVAYLADVFEANNKLSLKLQGRNTSIIAHYGAITAWRKFSFFSTDVMLKTFCHSLISANSQLKRNILIISTCLKGTKFSSGSQPHYFSDATLDDPVWKLV